MSVATVTGNATRDVELRYSAAGNAVAKFGLAENRGRKQADGSYTDEVSFFDVTCFGTLAENVAETIAKGTRVVVTGRLQQDTWQDKDTGANRSKVVIIADEIGPSLRWATAQITKSEQATGSAPSTTPTSADNYDPNMEPF